MTFQYGSKRCLLGDECLPPWYGAGATGTDATNGYFSKQDFIKLIQAAKNSNINVIPKINIMGGLLPAKRAAHHRYLKLFKQNPKVAESLHLKQDGPSLPAGIKLKSKWSSDSLLDHCDDATKHFTRFIISSIVDMYKIANVPLKGFNIGGDELTQFLGEFSSCKAKGLTTADVLRAVLVDIRNLLPAKTRLHVNEEVVTDPSTGDCLLVSYLSIKAIFNTSIQHNWWLILTVNFTKLSLFKL